MVSQADWVIDLGPEGGNTGGEVVFTGIPAELAAVGGTHTGEHLRAYRDAASGPAPS